MRYVTLTKENWIYGKSSRLAYHESANESRSCCVGVALAGFGVDKDKYKGLGTLEGIDIDSIPRELREINEAEMMALYADNDTTASQPSFSTPEKRVERLNVVLKRAGAAFRFKYVDAT